MFQPTSGSRVPAACHWLSLHPIQSDACDEPQCDPTFFFLMQGHFTMRHPYSIGCIARCTFRLHVKDFIVFPHREIIWFFRSDIPRPVDTPNALALAS